MSVLKPSEKKQIGEAIAQAELKTSGEIVVYAVAQSGGYRWIYGVSLLAGWALGTVAAFLIHGHVWGVDGTTLLTWQAGASTGLLALLQFRGLRRLVVRKQEMAERVHNSAIQIFVESGTLKTIERTGVLIYVSEFEHRVEILADVGIHSIVGDSYWKQQVDHIAEGIRKNRAADAICEAVKEIGGKLAERFPPSAENPNELPNEPI